MEFTLLCLFFFFFGFLILSDFCLSCLNQLRVSGIPAVGPHKPAGAPLSNEKAFQSNPERRINRNLRLTLYFLWVIEICHGWRRGLGGVCVFPKRGCLTGWRKIPPRSAGLHSKQPSWRRRPCGFVDQHCMHLIIFQCRLGFFSGVWLGLSSCSLQLPSQDRAAQGTQCLLVEPSCNWNIRS